MLDNKSFVHIQYQYFNSKGEQHTKILEGTLKSCITKMKRHLLNNELYQISHISTNLIGYDWSNHGENFISNYK